MSHGAEWAQSRGWEPSWPPHGRLSVPEDRRSPRLLYLFPVLKPSSAVPIVTVTQPSPSEGRIVSERHFIGSRRQSRGVEALGETDKEADRPTLGPEGSEHHHGRKDSHQGEPS